MFAYMKIQYLAPVNPHYFTKKLSQVVALELKKPSPKAVANSRIADKIRVYVRGGSGGQGCPSAGGIGGKGGNVFVKCMKGASLSPYILRQNRRIIAGHGSHYKRSSLKTISGKDVYVVVPPGTEVRSSKNVLITDLGKHGEVVKLANGGMSGSARTTDFNGEKGERCNIILELKTIADVSLTGFPNAGKSSLLKVLSRARPKIGDYPFTTINPMVGSIFYSDSRQVTVADLPGLIEDAHQNKGMGHRFLRHIERTKVILLVVDINGFQLKADKPYRSALETIILLLKELALYQDVLLKRPTFLLLNKMDTEKAQEKHDELINELTCVDLQHKHLKDLDFAEEIVENVQHFSKNNFENTLCVSSKKGHGLDELKMKLYNIVSSIDSTY